MEIEIEFREENLENPLVTVSARQKNEAVSDLMAYIQRYRGNVTKALMLKIEDHLLMFKYQEIILIEIMDNQLEIYTTRGIYRVNDSLANLKEKLPKDVFIQVSRFALININHLDSLSDSFSGNMTAKLTNQVKTSVSRRYVKSLMAFLGI